MDDTSFTFPRTITREELLIDGNDRLLRRLLYDVTALATRIEQMRTEFAKRLGVTKPQYNILLHVAQHQGELGRTVAQVAEALHVSGAHVTKEVGRLVEMDLLSKSANPDDGRSVLVKITPTCAEAIHALAPVLRNVNDSLFGSLDRESFATLSEGIHATLNDAEATLRKLPFFLENSD